MFYAKNVPGWERVLRFLMGFAGLAYAIMHWNSSAVAVGGGLAGAMIAMTGLIGFCPMCALVGRKLEKTR